MLPCSSLSKGFWGETMLTTPYLFNRVPNIRNKITPYKIWSERPPNLRFLKVWGCRAVVMISKPKTKNLVERDIDCILIGYVENSKSCRFYVVEPNDSVSSIPRPKIMIVSSNNSESSYFEDDIPTMSAQPRISNRAKKTRDYGYDFHLEGS